MESGAVTPPAEDGAEGAAIAGMARAPRSPPVSVPSPPRSFGDIAGIAHDGEMQHKINMLQADVGAIKGELGELKELLRSVIAKGGAQ